MSSFNCEVRIVGVKDLELSSTETLFVRCYLSAGKNKRVALNRREISSKSDFVWDESFMLECLGMEESVKQGTVVFELWRRRRSAVPILNKVMRHKSQLLGRAEIYWKQVFESPNLVIDKWVPLGLPDGHRRSGKEPELLVTMAVRVPTKAEERRRRRRRRRTSCECGCQNGNVGHCEDYDIYSIAAALEGLL